MDLLERLTQTPGIPGREERLRELILKETKGLFDETRVDAMGSLIGVRKPQGKKGQGPGAKGQGPGAKGQGPGAKGQGEAGRPLRVMLAAHMDQIGFMVRHVDGKGCVRVHNVGGFDTRNLFARVVTVCTESGDLAGVLNPGGRPLHISTEEDRKKIPEVSDFVVDMGLPAEEVKAKVKVGDMVVLRAPFTRVGNTAVAQAMDDRLACWLAIRGVEAAAKSGHGCEIHCVFTVQEEVGCRGAGPASFGIEPDVAIALDSMLAVDTPGVPEDQAVTVQGGGAAIMVMDSSVISDPGLVREFEGLAKKHKIKYQRGLLPRGGTDAAPIQRTQAGYRVLTLTCPTRYIHTVTEMVLLDDLYACRDLLAAYLHEAK